MGTETIRGAWNIVPAKIPAVEYVAIDYDDTLKGRVEVFRPFIEALRKTSHVPIIVTARSRKHLEDHHIKDLVPDAIELGLDIIFCHWMPKQYCANICGVRPAFWVDDSPEVIKRSWEAGERDSIEEVIDKGYICRVSVEELKCLIQNNSDS